MSCIVVTGSTNSGWGVICDLLDASNLPRLGHHYDGEPAAPSATGHIQPDDLQALWGLAANARGYVAVDDLSSRLDSIQQLPANVFFLIACSTPEHALRGQLSGGTDAPTAERVRALLAQWERQLRNILGFVYRFRRRCVLVDAAACQEDSTMLRAALQRRFAITLEPGHVSLGPRNDLPEFHHLGTLIAADLIMEDANIDELYAEVEGACDVVGTSPAVGAGLRSRREQLLVRCVDEYRKLGTQIHDLQDTEAELQMAAVQIADLHRELEERYQELEDCRTKLATMAHWSGHLPTLSLVRRARARHTV